jgi:hypothetical protein
MIQGVECCNDALDRVRGILPTAEEIQSFAQFAWISSQAYDGYVFANTINVSYDRNAGHCDWLMGNETWCRIQLQALQTSTVFGKTILQQPHMSAAVLDNYNNANDNAYNVVLSETDVNGLEEDVETGQLLDASPLMSRPTKPRPNASLKATNADVASGIADSNNAGNPVQSIRSKRTVCNCRWSISRRWIFFLLILASVAGIVAVAAYLAALKDSMDPRATPGHAVKRSGASMTTNLFTFTEDAVECTTSKGNKILCPRRMTRWA